MRGTILPRVLGWCALGLAIGSVVMSVLVVRSSPLALAQALAFDLPLRSLGETTLGMMIPIALSGAALLASVPLLRRPIGRAALVASALSWLVVFAILGVRGFRSLF